MRGQGDLDVWAILGSLKAAGYDGDIAIEFEGLEDAEYASAVGLKKLAKENFADLSPHPLLVKLEYSHPTLSQRIDAIERGR